MGKKTVRINSTSNKMLSKCKCPCFVYKMKYIARGSCAASGLLATMEPPAFLPLISSFSFLSEKSQGEILHLKRHESTTFHIFSDPLFSAPFHYYL